MSAALPDQAIEEGRILEYSIDDTRREWAAIIEIPRSLLRALDTQGWFTVRLGDGRVGRGQMGECHPTDGGMMEVAFRGELIPK